LALKKLADIRQAFYRISLSQKSWWISTKLFTEYLFWLLKRWWKHTKDFIEILRGRKAGGYPPYVL
jgi:hypothetical protein